MKKVERGMRKVRRGMRKVGRGQEEQISYKCISYNNVKNIREITVGMDYCYYEGGGAGGKLWENYEKLWNFPRWALNATGRKRHPIATSFSNPPCVYCTT